jgi:SAM-dependent methyltransferase
MDIIKHNQEAWDCEVENGNDATIPASTEEIEKARNGDWASLLSIPYEWLGDVKGKDILCLASRGGQQGPILAAAGANVTVFDNSPAQLHQDEIVAKKNNLVIHLQQGDMRDLSVFRDGSFDTIIQPISNHFVDDVQSVWKECYRVLKPGGVLIATFWNPVNYIFDMDKWDENKELVVRYKIPYSDLEQLPKERLKEYISCNEPLEFGHSLESQIGGQIRAGFLIGGFIESTFENDLLTSIMNTVITTKAIKPLNL